MHLTVADLAALLTAVAAAMSAFAALISALATLRDRLKKPPTG